MNCIVCLWYIHVKRNFATGQRCDLHSPVTLTHHSSSFSLLSSGAFSDPVNYRCNCLIPILSNSCVALVCVLVNDKPGILLSRLESMPLFVNEIYDHRIQTIKQFKTLYIFFNFVLPCIVV